MQLPEPAKELVRSGALGHLATTGSEGAPHVTCGWFGVDGEELVLATMFDQRKLRNMRRSPQVTISFESPRTNDWGLREYLVVDGVAEVTEGGAPELLQELAYVYIGPGVTFPQMPDPPPGFITRITPTRIGGVGPWAKA
jgi:PPOX class probable F420-dependent enzyme